MVKKVYYVKKTSALTSNILVLRITRKCDDKNDKIGALPIRVKSDENKGKKTHVLPTQKIMSQINGRCKVCTYTS